MLRQHSKADDWGRYVDLGVQFAVAVGAGVGIGYYLDQKWHTSPVLFLVGLLLGATSGFVNIYRAVFPATKQQDHPERHRE